MGLKYFHIRDEGDPVKPGISIWRLTRKERSIGFILNLDRLYVYVRYSKVKRRIFWECARREPKAWRILKGE